MFIEVRDSRVIAAIIDCLNLPISKKVDVAIIESTQITFKSEIYLEDHCVVHRSTVKDIWSTPVIPYWGGFILEVMHSLDIGCWKIPVSNIDKTRYISHYSRKGKIEHGRYYEPSMD